MKKNKLFFLDIQAFSTESLSQKICTQKQHYPEINQKPLGRCVSDWLVGWQVKGVMGTTKWKVVLPGKAPEKYLGFLKKNEQITFLFQKVQFIMLDK